MFSDYRSSLKGALEDMGYKASWHLLNASDFGVPQLRPRVAIVAVRKEFAAHFQPPLSTGRLAPTVGETLHDLMEARGWRGAKAWKKRANEVAPTIVGGSKKHGGADLGPTRSRLAWASLGVNGKSLAEEAPDPDFVGMPRLTLRMAARIQGFPDDWQFSGKKTTSYRQIGNAFPPPVARAVAWQIRSALLSEPVLAKSA